MPYGTKLTDFQLLTKTSGTDHQYQALSENTTPRLNLRAGSVACVLDVLWLVELCAESRYNTQTQTRLRLIYN